MLLEKLGVYLSKAKNVSVQSVQPSLSRSLRWTETRKTRKTSLARKPKTSPPCKHPCPKNINKRKRPCKHPCQKNINKNKETLLFLTRSLLLEKRRLPTLPRVCSTIGADGLNFSVRNGKRWNPDTITTWIMVTYLDTTKVECSTLNVLTFTFSSRAMLTV